MKNSNLYQKKLKSFLGTLKKRPASERGSQQEPLEHMILGILRANATRQQAMAGLKSLWEEFVDFNEMRVAPPKDISELLGPEMPLTRLKSEMLTTALNRVLDQGNDLSLQYMADLGKRELHAHLRDQLGLDSHAEAYVVLHILGGHAIPVDHRLAEKLKQEDLVHPEATVDQIRDLLEKLVSAKAASETYEALSAYAAVASKAKPAKAPKPAEAEAKVKKAAVTEKKAVKAAGKSKKKTGK